ncbi:MAG TPA: MoaF N-terminal domain-containing protein [Gammaproteobacteria bacterium]|nr:MoaF N-terminal domain-containing protein [Gammaproteobacteria bacterium]
MNVQTIAYPKEQMHRFVYTKLTSDQIAAKLAAAAGPRSASPLSDVFAGQSLQIVTDNGPTLRYRFTGNDRLSVAENGGAAVNGRYAALTLGEVAFFTHLVPGTQRGYNVVVDRASGLATVFEVWFSGFSDNREVQREIYFGYVAETGKTPPEARHALTNRIEGKGFYWRQDTGVETLELYPSTFYSNFVELSRLGGELGFCAPSDYVKINDDLYVYSRVECEFSGVMTFYVLDVNRAEQIGMRLGFDSGDALEYYAFTGRGEWVGQLAQFERFGDVAATPMPAPANGAPLAKGARRVYRPMRNNWTMSKAEVAALTEKNVFGPPSPMAGNKSPISELLVGKELTLRFDNGVAVDYRFDEVQRLRWRHAGENTWHEERYESWESAPGVVMFGHLVTGAPSHDCYKLVADFEHALVTCIHGTIGSEYIANEAQADTWFGVIEMEGLTPPKYRRHHFSDELVGRAVTWNYSPGLTSMHLYTTPHSLSWIIFGESGAGGMEWSGPASYVKIRDELYLAYWLEEACNGTLGTILVNLRTMHDCGIGYHCGRDGLRLSAMGAHARHAGRFDIAKYYRLKA